MKIHKFFYATPKKSICLATIKNSAFPYPLPFFLFQPASSQLLNAWYIAFVLCVLYAVHFKKLSVPFFLLLSSPPFASYISTVLFQCIYYREPTVYFLFCFNYISSALGLVMVSSSGSAGLDLNIPFASGAP